MKLLVSTWLLALAAVGAAAVLVATAQAATA